MVMPGAIKKQDGVTLIEVFVASFLMAVIAFGLFSLQMVYNRELRQGVAMTRLQMQYENLAMQVGALTHNAAAVVAVSETATWPIPSTWTADSANSVYIKDEDGTIIGGFDAASGSLREYKVATGTWIDYKAGNLQVSVASSPKSFFLSPTRNYLTLTLQINTTIGSDSYSLSSRGDQFKCRN